MRERILGYVLASVILGVIVVVAAVTLSELTPSDVKPINVEITQPETTVEVGQQIVVKAEGSGTAWTTEPDTEDYVTYGSENENFAGSFRRPGTYVVLSAAIKDGVVQFRKYRIIVVAPGYTPPAPPAPEPAEPEVSPLHGVLKAAMPDDATTATKLADSFRSVADEIDAAISVPRLIPTDDIVGMTARSNRKALGDKYGEWEEFFKVLQVELTKLSETGSLVTMQDHVGVWRSIADVLSKGP